jgi:Cu(I)/Ag(I) efflux system membrane protein CusA/SilA
MIDRTISWCVSNRVLVLAASVAVAICGAWAMQRAPLDALPDLSDVQVIVATEWPGRSPDLIEDQVTYPIVSALLPTPKVRSVRGFTDFGVSYVYVIFEDDTDIYWARSRVLEYLQGMRATLPAGVTPTMAPDATGAGWVFEYALVDESGQHTLDELRSLQDWTLRYSLASIPGVAEVASIGGFVKQYQVNLDPNRLSAYGMSPKQVVDAIRASNNDVEGRLLEFAGREYMVRARGYLTSVADIEQVSLGADATGTPIRIADVAEVRIGPDIRRGVAELDGRGEAVGGIVVMRFNENALRVIDQVKSKLADVQRTLPKGIAIVPTYDRSGLIRSSVGTLRRVLLEEIIVVSLALILFLSHVRSALVPVLALPVAVISAFIPIWYFGISLNIMSLGGIALAIGVLVDGSIVMVENCYRRIAEESCPPDGRWQVMVDASRQVGRPVFFSLAVIVVSFTPVFLLEGQEGRLFQPLALTKTFAVAAATLLALTLVPVLIATFLVPSLGAASRRPNRITRFCTSLYEPVLRFALQWKWSFLAVNAAIVPLTLLLLLTLGHEFMPPLYEGSLLYMPTAPPGLSVSEATRLLQQQDRVLRTFPEVERVFGTAGRSTTATDNSPMGMVNTIVTLKPRDEWRAGMTFDRLQSEMDRALQFPGVPNTWTQPIRGRLDMLSTGIKSPIGVKILGSDSKVIQDLGIAVERILRAVPGTRNVYADRVADGYFADIRINRAAIARYGLTVEDVEQVVQSAIGGGNIGQTIEGRERYPINVRYQQDFRKDVPALERVLVKSPRGLQIPLGQLADVVLMTGPAMIRDENGRLAGYVYVDADTRDLAGYVGRARAAIGRQLTLPSGYELAWSGQYELLLRAAERLRLIVPIALLAIFVLLYLAFRSSSEALIVMLSVIYAMTGGVIFQWLMGYNFSVAVWVGYITLYGVAIQTGVIMVMYLHEALDRRAAAGHLMDETDLYEATVAGAVLRLRPKLMTVATTIGGLLPIMWSTGVGSDLMKPIAAPIIGGMVTSAVHVLLITPIIFFLLKRRALKRGALSVQATRPDGRSVVVRTAT